MDMRQAGQAAEHFERRGHVQAWTAALLASTMILASTGIGHTQQRSIINPSFEQPADISAFFSGFLGLHYVPQDNVPGWFTTETADDNSIEFWEEPNFASLPANPEGGARWVELNYQNAASLYQNLCMTNGETISWTFDHRSRGGGDEQTNFDVADSSNTLIQTLASQTSNSTGGTANTIAGSTATSTPVGDNWHRNAGSATYIGATGVQRVRFTSETGSASGNFLDNIQVEFAVYSELESSTATALEGSTIGVPAIVLSGNLDSDATFPITVTGGTASAADYTTAATIVVPAGNYNGHAFMLPFTAIADGVADAGETVQLTIGMPTSTDSITLASLSCSGAAISTTTVTIEEADYGDAPTSGTAPNGTSTNNYGIAGHILNAGLRLGTNNNADDSSIANADASGDGTDDDGVSAFPLLGNTDTSYSVDATVTNTTGTAATLHGWVDFDGNGTFDADEHASVSVANGTSGGTATLNWGGLTGIVPGDSFVRLRLTTDASVTASTPDGGADDGEVEDYALAIWDSQVGDFITTWETTAAGQGITIETTGTGYNYDVDWDGDGIFDAFGMTGDATHTYASAGTHTVRIRGAFPRIFFVGSGDRDKIRTVEQWGAIEWQSMRSAFQGATNMAVPATDAPDLSNVTDMGLMFANAEGLTDEDFSGWDTSNVQLMDSMFTVARNFNGDVSTWDTSSVTNMTDMFRTTDAFNGDISFKAGAAVGGGDAWNTSSVTNMDGMFRSTEAFNQDIGNWNTTNVTSMLGMFAGATAFNQDIGSWQTDSLTNAWLMFRDAANFNQDIDTKPGLGNQGGTAWDMSNVTITSLMFQNATSFNQDLNNWNVASVTNFSSMFDGATAFNGDVSAWTPAAATNMSTMFQNASAFDRDLGGWDIADVTSMASMLDNSNLSVANYDATLIGWGGQAVQSNVPLGAAGLTYCLGAGAHNVLTGIHNWNISGDTGPACDRSDAPLSGTAPDGTSTIAYGEARHAVIADLQLGAANDIDNAPIANADASGDGADDDGVSSFAVLNISDTSYSVDATVTNTTGTAATLHGWIDFDGNGTFDTDEHASVSVANGTSGGTVTLSWSGLSGLVDESIFVRLRLTTDPSVTTSTPAASADDGEVEDYAVTFFRQDFGDAPNIPTGQVDGWHASTEALAFYLGAVAPDPETDAQPSANADGDDNDATDDEDLDTALVDGTVGFENEPTRANGTFAFDVAVTEPTAGSGYLSVFVDTNGDGVFDATVATDVRDDGTGNDGTAGDGFITVSGTSFPGATAGTDYAVRFRFCSTAGDCDDPTEPADDGELEDHMVTAVGPAGPGAVSCQAMVGNPSLNGDTSITALNEILLTRDGVAFEDSTIWSQDRIDLTEPFTLEFDVFLGDDDVNTGGLAFALHADPRGASVLGERLGGNAVGGLDPAIAIEFDTFPHAGDPGVDHTVIFDPLNLGENQGGVGVIENSNTNFTDLEDGQWRTAVVSWNPATQRFAYTFDGTLIASFTRDIINTDFDGSSLVHFGFGSSSGNFANADRRAVCLKQQPQLVPVDHGDAPLDYGDALHQIVTGLSLGPTVTADDGPYDSAVADGDSDDSITFPSLIVGSDTTISIAVNENAAGEGYLQGWIDYNGNSTFDAGEQIITDIQDNGPGDEDATAGTIAITLSVPATVTLSEGFARLRWSTEMGLAVSGIASDGEVEDYLVTFLRADYGDAPNIPTGQLDGRHVNSETPSFYLGAVAPDSEADAQPSANADADDNDGINDDEDLDTITVDGTVGFEDLPTVAGGIYSFDVAVTEPNAGDGYLSVWVDTTGNGTFDAQIANELRDNGTGGDLVAGDGHINVAGSAFPGTAHGTAYAVRFRFCSTAGDCDDPTEEAADGELEDHMVTTAELDYGDAPQASGYPTSLAQDGARHAINPTTVVRIGTTPTDAEDGNAVTGDATATADDLDNANDEDGSAALPDEFSQSLPFSFSLNVVGSGFLNIWVDWNADGDFSDPGEHILDDQAVFTGNNPVNGTTPTGSTVGNTFMRMRICADAGACNTPTGLAMSGEVEDHQITIVESDLIIRGSVFEDRGTGIAGNVEAHDGVFQTATERRLAGVTVEAFDIVLGQVIVSTSTDGNGAYELVIPNSSVGDEIMIRTELSDPQWMHISDFSTTFQGTDPIPPGFNGGDGAEDQNQQDGQFSIVPTAGMILDNVDFGQIGRPTLSANQGIATLPGDTETFAHSYTASSNGDVFLAPFVVSETPSATAFTDINLFVDNNANAVFDAGDTPITGTIAVAAGEVLRLLARVQTNAGAPPNAELIFEVVAFTDFNQTIADVDPYTVNGSAEGCAALVASLPGGFDPDHCTTKSNSMKVSEPVALDLVKAVCNDTAGSTEFGPYNAGSPGDVLVYKLTVTNPTVNPAIDVSVYDNTPLYTSAFGAVPASDPITPTALSPAPVNCPGGGQSSVPGTLSCTMAAPASGNAGAIQWECTGQFGPGSLAEFYFQVQIDP